MSLKIILIPFIVFIGLSCPAQELSTNTSNNNITLSESTEKDSISEHKSFLRDRVIPAAFVLLTGPIGGHRIILGTGPVVPAVYAITLGGGLGILPAIDFFAILFSGNASKFKNNRKIIMWIE
ncbi:MAG: hypothetical protein A2W91_12495 [Bacteroidetes bacterium GWF2_38_335]|nr:MAG: hypothetical protein A2W91_12495 [Bacteroidetes bacterium GWF2_38_335]OFY76987.1 MAG: hypothetical protein A2281_00610 [Bacteroidetes bacterium RIFOXYA12_FULL_38_20]HBS86843.1 hypothetical protein [Bacteroidales bacterium]